VTKVTWTDFQLYLVCKFQRKLIKLSKYLITKIVTANLSEQEYLDRAKQMRVKTAPFGWHSIRTVAPLPAAMTEIFLCFTVTESQDVFTLP
jgi:hypothetical protein